MKVTSPLLDNFIGGVVHRIEVEGSDLVWIRATIVDAYVKGIRREDRQLIIDTHSAVSLSEDKTWSDVHANVRFLTPLAGYSGVLESDDEVLSIEADDPVAPVFILISPSGPGLTEYKRAWPNEDGDSVSMMRVVFALHPDDEQVDEGWQDRLLEQMGIDPETRLDSG